MRFPGRGSPRAGAWGKGVKDGGAFGCMGWVGCGGCRDSQGQGGKERPDWGALNAQLGASTSSGGSKQCASLCPWAAMVHHSYHLGPEGRFIIEAQLLPMGLAEQAG